MLSSITRILLFATAFALPLTVLRPFTIGPFIFSPSKAITTGLLLWMPVVWLASRRPYPADRKLLWLVAFTFSVAVSLTTTFFGGVSAITSVIVFTTYAAIALFYVLIVYLVNDVASVRAIVFGYVGGISLAAASVMTGYSKVSNETRTGGMGGDPNHYAYDAAIGICFAIVIFVTWRPVLVRIFALSASLLALAGVIASVSRSGFVTVVAILCLWIVRFRRFNVLIYVVPGAIVLGAFVLTASEGWRDRMMTMSTAESREADGSIESRFVVGEYAVRAFADNPLTGVGFLQFGTWASEYNRAARQSGRGGGGLSADAGHIQVGGAIHNSYLHVLAEMGIIGTVPYIALLTLAWFDFSYAWLLARRRLDDPQMRELYYLATFFQIAFFGALVDNLFLSSLRYKSIWLLLGLSTVMIRLVRMRAVELGDESEAVPETQGPLGSIPGIAGAAPEVSPRRF